MLFGSYEELEACIQLLLQLRTEAAAEMLRDSERVRPRYLALQGLIEQYESYAAFARQFFGHRQPDLPDL
jgi:hypothetical protein